MTGVQTCALPISGVADSLRQFRRQVYDYVGSRKASKGEFLNVKAEWYWLLRDRFLKGEICGGVIDEEMKQSLSALRYEYKAGKLKMEKKAKTKIRLHRSPDDADALMMAYAPVDAIKSKVKLVRVQKKVDKLFRRRAIFG